MFCNNLDIYACFTNYDFEIQISLNYREKQNQGRIEQIYVSNIYYSILIKQYYKFLTKFQSIKCIRTDIDIIMIVTSLNSWKLTDRSINTINTFVFVYRSYSANVCTTQEVTIVKNAYQSSTKCHGKLGVFRTSDVKVFFPVFL